MPRGKSKPASPSDNEESSSSASYSESGESSSGEDFEEDESTSEDDDEVSSDGSDDGGIDDGNEKPTDEKTKKRGLRGRGRAHTSAERNDTDGGKEKGKKVGRFARAMSMSRSRAKNGSNNANDSGIDGSERNDDDNSLSSEDIHDESEPKKGTKEGKSNVPSKFNLSSISISKRFGKKKGGEQLGEEGGNGRDDAGELAEKYLKVLTYLKELRTSFEGVENKLGKVQNELGKVKEQAAIDKENDQDEKELLRVQIESLRGDLMNQGEQYSSGEQNIVENEIVLKKARTEINDLKEKTVSLADGLDAEKLKVLELQKALGDMQVSQKNGRKKEDEKSYPAEDTLQREIVENVLTPEHRKERKSSSKKKRSHDRDPSKRKSQSGRDMAASSKLKEQPLSSGKDASTSKLRRRSSTGEKDVPASTPKPMRRASAEKEEMPSRI